MKKLFLSIVLVALAVSFTFSQEKRIDFNSNPIKSKAEVEKPGFRAVSFVLLGISNESKKIEVQELLNNSGMVSDCKVQLSGKCFMFLKEEITADELRANYLLPNLVDYDFTSVKIIDKSLLGKTPAKLPADYPKFINTGNPEADKADYDARKKEWIENNPEEYKKISEGNPSEEEKRREEIIKIEKSKSN
ncbi:MAG: hypothetical protein JXR58_10200 [Bacteroidales bacterium]|nr:hypothetical protein [Bacteroidales bacterium]